MGKIKLAEKFKKGDVADTSELLLPKEYYHIFWENSDDEEFFTKDGELEFAANDRCKKSYKLTLTIEHNDTIATP